MSGWAFELSKTVEVGRHSPAEAQALVAKVEWAEKSRFEGHKLRVQSCSTLCYICPDMRSPVAIVVAEVMEEGADNLAVAG